MWDTNWTILLYVYTFYSHYNMDWIVTTDIELDNSVIMRLSAKADTQEGYIVFLARLHEVHRAIVVTSVVPVYVYVYVYVLVRVTLSVKVFL